MKHLSAYDNISETEAWYFWVNVKVLLGHLDWGLGSKGPHIVFWVCVLSAMILSGQTFC